MRTIIYSSFFIHDGYRYRISSTNTHHFQIPTRRKCCLCHFTSTNHYTIYDGCRIFTSSPMTSQTYGWDETTINLHGWLWHCFTNTKNHHCQSLKIIINHYDSQINHYESSITIIIIHHDYPLLIHYYSIINYYYPFLTQFSHCNS